jgi:hypothetical protein
MLFLMLPLQMLHQIVFSLPHFMLLLASGDSASEEFACNIVFTCFMSSKVMWRSEPDRADATKVRVATHTFVYTTDVALVFVFSKKSDVLVSTIRHRAEELWCVGTMTVVCEYMSAQILFIVESLRTHVTPEFPFLHRSVCFLMFSNAHDQLTTFSNIVDEHTSNRNAVGTTCYTAAQGILCFQFLCRLRSGFVGPSPNHLPM